MLFIKNCHGFGCKVIFNTFQTCLKKQNNLWTFGCTVQPCNLYFQKTEMYSWFYIIYSPLFIHALSHILMFYSNFEYSWFGLLCVPLFQSNFRSRVRKNLASFQAYVWGGVGGGEGILGQETSHPTPAERSKFGRTSPLNSWILTLYPDSSYRSRSSSAINILSVRDQMSSLPRCLWIRNNLFRIQIRFWSGTGSDPWTKLIKFDLR